MLGRAHSFEEFLNTYAHAREAGFENVSVDLMYGLPDGSLSRFRESLHTVARLGPEHISAYGLKIEEGTPFFRRKTSLRLPDEDTEYEMYRSMTEILTAYGYRKYEISNFAKEGRESRHNLRYWQRKDYLGFGVAAHSCFEETRFGNSRNMDAFLRGEDITEEREGLTERDRLEEYVMLSLRLAEGLSETTLRERFGLSLRGLSPRLPQYLSEGYMTERNGRLSFTDKGFFVSNTILSDLINFD
jgi:oxygen-independent coproporphyrinogen-3 oxidase